VEGDSDQYVSLGYRDSSSFADVAPVISSLNKQELVLVKQKGSDGLTKYRTEMTDAQTKKKEHYVAAVKKQKELDDAKALVPYSGTLKAVVVIEEPLPANEVNLYDPDIFGLDIAARDCRFEMIKIVREVSR
jgi:phage terminase Nu1 subunit (DNA packaging protein)